MPPEHEDQPRGAGWGDLDDSETVSGKSERDITARLIVAGIALLAAIAFVVQNGDEVEMRFLFFTGTQPLWVVIVVSLLLGALLGQAVALLWARRRNRS